MMRTSRETAECPLAQAHALRLHAHRSLVVGARERTDLDACIGHFEASLLLDAPPSVIGEFGALLDEQIHALRARMAPPATCARGAAAASPAWTCTP